MLYEKWLIYVHILIIEQLKNCQLVMKIVFFQSTDVKV